MVSHDHTTTDGQHRTIAPTTRKPSAALDAFVAEVEQDGHVVYSLTREPREDTPVGALLIEHPEFPEPTQVVVDSITDEAFTHKPTLFTVSHVTQTDILPVADDAGLRFALRSASERMKSERERHADTRLSKAVRWVKHTDDRLSKAMYWARYSGNGHGRPLNASGPP